MVHSSFKVDFFSASSFGNVFIAFFMNGSCNNELESFELIRLELIMKKCGFTAFVISSFHQIRGIPSYLN